MPTLYTADRCPYAARARIVLAEKQIAYDAFEIDLDDRPAWLYDKNPLGKVPVWEEDEGLVLPESEVIMEYLEERYPGDGRAGEARTPSERHRKRRLRPALLPADPAERALARLWVHRFDEQLGDAYYAARRGDGGALEVTLSTLDGVLEGRPWLTGREYGLADIAYAPWILRALQRFGVELGPALAAWLERVSSRPAVAAEREVVAAL